MATMMPKITVHPTPKAAPPASATSDDPLLALIESLRSPVRTIRVSDLARALITEGKSFARTPSGRRWASLLAGSTIVENGWLLWNQANLDLSCAEPSGDTPTAMVDAVLRRLTSDDLEKYVTFLGAVLAEEAVSSSVADRP
jgi:hypothetical protein